MSLPNSSLRVPRKAGIAVTAAFIILLLFFFIGNPVPARYRSSFQDSFEDSLQDDTHSLPLAVPIPGDLPCRSLPGGDDVAVIVKTGSTEFQDKFPVHTKTTLNCYPHFLVFSDYEETYDGIHVFDALESIDDKTKNEHADFELWRRLRDGGREALESDELSGPLSASQVSKLGNTGNPGWKLDKWKFLPMANRTLHEQPDRKWYLFVEVDTYIFWQTLLNYLKALDSSKPLYVGNMIHMGEVKFAHGGTGFVLSHTALENLVKLYRDEKAVWDKEVDDTWAGDAVFGKALAQSGAHFIGAEPIFQGDEVGGVPYDKDAWWCRPTVSYHHLSVPVVEDMWNFEQQWIAGTGGDSSKFLRHCEIFDQYAFPRIPGATDGFTRTGWTNNAQADRGEVQTLEQCQAICEAHAKCVQYLVDNDKRCKTSEVPGLGEMMTGIDSGWMLERIKSWRKGKTACSDDNNWIT